VRYDSERFRLKPGVADYVAEREAQVAAAEAEAAAELAKERAAHENTKRLLQERIIGDALDQALKANGADPRTRHGARAQLRSIWNFAVDGDATFSWGLTWRNVKCELGRRKILPSLRSIQKPERRSQRFRK
jgi:hypothetical protein